jgi:hypothetical protein
VKPEKDIQLDRAISILEHWSKYKVQLAKADDPVAPAVAAAAKGSGAAANQ